MSAGAWRPAGFSGSRCSFHSAPKSTGVLHYEWYNTPNTRFFTIADFEDFCRQKDIRVHRRIALDTEAKTEVFEHPNLNADLAIFVISRA